MKTHACFRIFLLLSFAGALFLMMKFQKWTGQRRTTRLKGSENYSTYGEVKEEKAFKYDFDEKRNETEEEPFRRPRFNFLKEPNIMKPKPCQGDACGQINNTRWTMVNFIKSKTSNFANRADVRLTWADTHYSNGAAFFTVFVVARAANEREAALLQEEHERFGDLLQLDGPDEYRYVPLKTLAGMQWASENLPVQYFYSSGDDDFLIHVGRVQQIIDEYIKIVDKQQWPTFPIICTYRTMPNLEPYREPNGQFKKWFVSRQEYKWPYYPKGCFGGYYSTSVALVTQLFQTSTTERYLRVDDIWVTGILRIKLDIPDGMVITPKYQMASHGLGGKASSAKNIF